MFDLDFGTAIVATVQFVIGAGAWKLGQYLAQRTKHPTTRVLLSWPCYGVGIIFVSSALLTMLLNMFGPVLLWLWGLFHSS